MDGEGEPVHSKKAHKKVGKHQHFHVSTVSKSHRSKHAPVPPSYTGDEYKVCSEAVSGDMCFYLFETKCFGVLI